MNAIFSQIINKSSLMYSSQKGQIVFWKINFDKISALYILPFRERFRVQFKDDWELSLALYDKHIFVNSSSVFSITCTVQKLKFSKCD